MKYFVDEMAILQFLLRKRAAVRTYTCWHIAIMAPENNVNVGTMTRTFRRFKIQSMSKFTYIIRMNNYLQFR